MNHRIQITPTLIQRDSDGALFVRYAPSLTPNVIAHGTLTFAVFEEEVGAGQAAHEAAQRAARENAINSLHLLAKEFAT